MNRIVLQKKTMTLKKKVQNQRDFEKDDGKSLLNLLRTKVEDTSPSQREKQASWRKYSFKFIHYHKIRESDINTRKNRNFPFSNFNFFEFDWTESLPLFSLSSFQGIRVGNTHWNSSSASCCQWNGFSFTSSLFLFLFLFVFVLLLSSVLPHSFISTIPWICDLGHVYTFATNKLQPLITQPEGKSLIQACLNAPDVPSSPPSYSSRNNSVNRFDNENSDKSNPNTVFSSNLNNNHNNSNSSSNSNNNNKNVQNFFRLVIYNTIDSKFVWFCVVRELLIKNLNHRCQCFLHNKSPLCLLCLPYIHLYHLILLILFLLFSSTRRKKFQSNKSPQLLQLQNSIRISHHHITHNFLLYLNNLFLVCFHNLSFPLTPSLCFSYSFNAIIFCLALTNIQICLYKRNFATIHI